MLPARYLIICPLLFCGCSESSPVSNPLHPAPALKASELDSRVLKLFGGAEGWKPLADPVRVEAFRVDPVSRGEKTDPDSTNLEQQQFAGYPILSGPTVVDQETAQSLARTLSRPSTYGWDFAKGCEFSPGVGIRFVGSSATMELLFCFSCDEFKIVRDGKTVGHEDTDGARTALVNIARKIFPDDKEIQNLRTAEEQAVIDNAEENKRNDQLRAWGKLMPDAAVTALIDHDTGKFEKIIAAMPGTAKQIRALMHFAGGPNDSWSSYTGVEINVDSVLKGYSKEELAGPVEDALLGNDRLIRRGAARLWQSWRSPLEDWSPEKLSRLQSVCLTVMQEARYYPTRQNAQLRLLRWASNLPDEEVERRLHAGLHDPHPGVRRSAMLAAGQLKWASACGYLLKQLAGETPATQPLPDVPEAERTDVPDGFDRIAGNRPEAEVAALALGYLGFTEALVPIQEKLNSAQAGEKEPSPMYEVAAALLGDMDRLRPKHFNLGERNKELQLAAVDAVVRAKGRRLELVFGYRQATHWWEEDRVVDRVRSMLVAENAPGGDLLKSCTNLKQLAAWHEKHGAEYQQRFVETPQLSGTAK